MMTAQQVFKEFESGKWRGFYLIVGEESFQAGEVIKKVKDFFLKGSEAHLSFSFESFEGDQLDVGALLASLQTLPGLFDGPETIRLVSCSRIDKLSSSDIEILENYFSDPCPSTCFLMTAAKVDKRKAWVKAIEQRGAIIEVNEPFERDWPKWRGYFERKSGKKISEEAWDRLVQSANFTLGLVWSEIQKAVLFVGEKQEITLSTIKELVSDGEAADVFAFTEDVVNRRRLDAMMKYEMLLREGENEVKILSLLVRHFRQVEGCLELLSKGIMDSKVTAQQIGIPPFFVSKIQGQAKRHTLDHLRQTFHLLAESDYSLKTGEGSLFDKFLVPYFQQA